MRIARTQVESVCSDSMLSPQQKRQRIHQIRSEAHEQAAGLLSEQQREAMKACGEHQGGGGRGAAMSNPCPNLGSAESPDAKP